MIKKAYLLIAIIGFASSLNGQTPVNQVFQFMQSGSCKKWADSSETKASLYLWVPKKCKKLKGLVIMCSNVPEHMLVGNPEIRKACASNNLGIIWSTPTFMNFRKSTAMDNKSLNMALEYKTTVDFLQELLDSLAKSSGYEEVATVPWLPIGESGHLLMVDALVEYKPERCIAGVWLKNNHLPPANRLVPALVVFGTSQEWGQDKVDIRNRWNQVGNDYGKILIERGLNPSWPLSYVIDGSSGHFDVSERIVKYLAHYIDVVAKRRLPGDDAKIKSIDLEKGFVTGLPVLSYKSSEVKSYFSHVSNMKALPWYFDEASAKEAKAIAAINWKAKTQLPGYINKNGQVLPFNFNGITSFSSLDLEDDGITFQIKGVMLDQLPSNFVGAGEKLAVAPGKPTVEWLCGAIEPLGDGRFRISMDRTFDNGAVYIGLRKKGNDSIRGIFEPAGINLKALRNLEGKTQTITFDKIGDVKSRVKSISLYAKSDAGLPVHFFVVAGPAIIQNNKLVFTKIPPRSRFPISITVAAWQWGRGIEPKVKTAQVLRQTFYILR